MSIDIFNKVLEEKVQNQNLPDKLNDEISVTKTEEVIENKNPEVVEKKETENEESLEKAIRDTRRNYQNINQKYVLAKKKYNNVINELRETILNENNSVLSEEEFNEHVKKLDSIFEVEKDDELEVENKKEDKVKNLRETLDKEFDTFKKYNKDKNLDKDYAAFYHAVTLLDSDQKEKLKQYVEEDPAEAIGYIIQIGQDYREDLEEGLNKHKNIFAYVSHLKGEIKRLNEEVKNKENIDNKFNNEDNKQIKYRSSPTFERKQGSDLLDHILSSRN